MNTIKCVVIVIYSLRYSNDGDHLDTSHTKSAITMEVQSNTREKIIREVEDKIKKRVFLCRWRC